MSVEIILPPMLQALTGDVKQFSASGKTLVACLNDLIEKYPEIKPKIFSRSGKLANGVNIFLNRENIPPDSLSKPVHDGDKIHISFVVLGG